MEYSFKKVGDHFEMMIDGRKCKTIDRPSVEYREFTGCAISLACLTCFLTGIILSGLIYGAFLFIDYVSDMEFFEIVYWIFIIAVVVGALISASFTICFAIFRFHIKIYTGKDLLLSKTYWSRDKFMSDCRKLSKGLEEI